jgi:RimJ/RimL family protein N-acetyltransferase
MQATGPILETERLILRPPAPEDLEPWVEMMADEETARFIGGVASRSMVWRQLCSMAGAWSLFGYAMFSVVEKSSGLWLGRLGPWTPADWPGTEVGWSLSKAAWGKGYATEGAAAAIDWAFDNLGWTEVIHCIDPENHPSAAVARRLGSSYLRPGKLPPPYETAQVEIWGQTREQWRARRSAA